jgi:hypothetical protein
MAQAAVAVPAAGGQQGRTHSKQQAKMAEAHREVLES